MLDDGIVDGVVYATMVALGFAMTENIQYYGAAGESAGAVFILRGMLSPYSHPLFTSMTGIGLGWAAQSDRWYVKLLAPPLGLLAAMTLHATWNLSATIHIDAWLASYVLIMFPAAVCVAIILIFALAREGRLLRHYLANELPPGDLKRVSSVWGRIGYSIGKFFKKGPLGWLRSEQYLQAASELAFLRHRTSRGFPPDPDQEQELQARLHQLGSQLQ